MRKNIMQQARELSEVDAKKENENFLLVIKITEFVSNFILIFMMVSLISGGDFVTKISYSLFFSATLFVTRAKRNENVARELSFLYIQKCIVLVIGIVVYIASLLS